MTDTLAITDREVSRALFEQFLKTTGRAVLPIDPWSPTGEHPMVAATWFEAVAFCRWLTEQAGMSEADQCYADPAADGIERIALEDGSQVPRDWPVNPQRPGFRLPDEIEWEFACRAGTATAYSFGNDAQLLKWYGRYFDDTKPRLTLARGELRPNLAGFFDMHGNTLEWCHAWLSGSLGETLPAAQQVTRVFRGGGWDNGANRCRSSHRNGERPMARLADCGIRLVRTMIPGQP